MRSSFRRSIAWKRSHRVQIVLRSTASEGVNTAIPPPRLYNREFIGNGKQNELGDVKKESDAVEVPRCASRCR